MDRQHFARPCRTLLALFLGIASASSEDASDSKDGRYIQWRRPWATHASCAEQVRRFDWNLNFSKEVYLRFNACVERRHELPDWRGPNRPALLSGEHYPVSVVPSPRDETSYWITPAWDYVVSNFVRREGTFEPEELELFKSLVHEGDVYCDLGSHVGSYALPMASHVGINGRVYAFEPFRLVFQLLMGNVAINGLANVYGNNVAVGAKAEVRSVKSPALTRSSNIGATSVYNQAREHYGENQVLQYEGTENVKVITFDSLNLQKVNFMKIDVEGALDKVLRGGQRTIKRFRPIIACEHGEGNGPPLLLEWGYKCVLALPIHELWVCVPKESWAKYSWLADVPEGGRYQAQQD